MYIYSDPNYDFFFISHHYLKTMAKAIIVAKYENLIATIMVLCSTFFKI